MTVVDDLMSGAEAGPTGGTSETATPALLGDDPETAVLRVVKDDPFATIGEMRDRLSESPALDDVGWWQIFRILRRHRLLRRRSRFRFARGRK